MNIITIKNDAGTPFTVIYDERPSSRADAVFTLTMYGNVIAVGSYEFGDDGGVCVFLADGFIDHKLRCPLANDHTPNEFEKRLSCESDHYQWVADAIEEYLGERGA